MYRIFAIMPDLKELRSDLVGLAAISIALVCLSMTAAHAAVSIIRESVTYSANLRETRFELIFDVPPDFNSLDEAGRQSDEFQYYLDRNGVLPVVEQADSLDILVRGGEIARTGAVIVRQAYPAADVAEAGGWGREIGRVPFELTGTTLRFVIPWAMLEEDDGLFSYALMLTRYGAMSDFRSGRSRLP